MAVILAFAIAACDVGSVVSNNTGGPDGNMPMGTADAPGSGSGSNCQQLSANIPAGNHNPGMTCLTAGCHLIGNAGTNAPEFSYAGTLWKDVNGTTPYPGATIEIVVGGATKKVIAADNGNFFLPPALATPPTAAATATTMASACPTTTPMSGALVDNGGNCNNCHHAGGTTSPIYLQ
jgi:hypothetical protein